MSERQPVSPREPPVNYECTEEEKRVMHECRLESFWYRSVPLGMLFVGTTQILVNRGILKPHARYGALFKNIGAAGIGYVFGKLSYVTTCRDKIMKLENSPIAESIRKGKAVTLSNPRYPRYEREHEQSVIVPPESSSRSSQIKEDYSSSSDMDVESKQLKGLDDNFRPSMDTDSDKPIQQNTEGTKSFTNYEDLRQQNRFEFSKKSQANQPQSGPPRISTNSGESQSYKKVRRNKYGDIIED